MSTEAKLMLEDGTLFTGEAFGAIGEAFGEAVFDTGMGAYQEMLTDPGHLRQIVVATAPHTGNTGWNEEDSQNPAGRIFATGYVVRDPSPRPSNWRSQRSLDDVLVAQGIVGAQGIDTRALTQHLRESGPMRAGVSSLPTTAAELLERVKASPTIDGLDLVTEVTTAQPYTVAATAEPRFTVAAIDLGITLGVVNEMAARGMTVTVLPASARLSDVQAVNPDGVCLAGGPGDPAALDTALAQALLAGGLPVLGIGLGCQVLARAAGLKTRRLPVGHHGVNLPVRRLADGRVMITAHNHCFTIEVPEGATAQVTHVAVNDGSVEGFLLPGAMGVQFNPAFGPHDAETVFDDFAAMMIKEAANA